ncbi:MAG TPA: hypothetical protein VHF22_05270 [Planctomycetota bacterium]|nr:hypothetical protein [Planctomycetota bacterium]
MGSPGAGRRLEELISLIMPAPVVPFEVACGDDRVRLGPGEPRVRLLVRDRAALKRHLLRRSPLVALALAFADGALDIDGDIFEAARLKDNFAQAPPGLAGRLRLALRILLW